MGQDEAGIDRLSIDNEGARAAVALLAAELDTGNIQVISQ
jgi:hypothetical protein